MPDPELATAPLMLPVLVPNVQLKLLAAVADNAIFGLVPLQMVTAEALSKAGTGFTVTVIVEAAPAQEPDMDVGVIRY